MAAGPERRLGLVLGGGGVRGLAHVGVLEELEAAGIRPVAVVGVSMGAVVGAAYAARADWSTALREEDWSGLPVAAEPRGEDTVERLRALARDARRLAPTVSRWRWRRGFADSARETVERILGPATQFDDTRLAFAAAATDVLAGQRAVLTEGGLVDAALASAAIPGLTAPVEIDGQLLVDGGFADPSPVDVARELGADVVAACHVGHPLEPRETENWVQLLLRALEVAQFRFAAERLRDADVAIRPAFETRPRMLDFSAVNAVIDAGAAGVRAELGALQRVLRAA